MARQKYKIMSITEFYNFFEEINIVAACFITMLALAICDLLTFYTKTWRYRNFKTTIVSLGILGTFIGISIGLADFDTTNIEGSVPQLLEGLKTAFSTSVMGLFFSVVLTIIERMAPYPDGKDVNSEKEQIAIMVEEIKKIHEQIRDESEKSRTLISDEFAKTNTALNESLQTISEGANRQIIEMLNESISGFNENLTEQFGENFRQLNDACLQLVKWQEQHKQEVDTTHKQLQDTINAIKETEQSLATVAERNEDTLKVYESLRKIIATYDNQTQALTSHLEKYGALADKAKTMFTDADSHFAKIAEDISKFSRTLNQQSEDIQVLTRSIIDSTTKMEEAFVMITEKMGDKYSEFVKIVEDIANLKSSSKQP